MKQSVWRGDMLYSSDGTVSVWLRPSSVSWLQSKVIHEQSKMYITMTHAGARKSNMNLIGALTSSKKNTQHWHYSYIIAVQVTQAYQTTVLIWFFLGMYLLNSFTSYKSAGSHTYIQVKPQYHRHLDIQEWPFFRERIRTDDVKTISLSCVLFFDHRKHRLYPAEATRRTRERNKSL